MNKLLKFLPLIVILVTLIVVTLVFRYIITPQQLVEKLGIHNSYLIIFILAFISGLLTFSVVPYHVVLVAFAVGGANPFFLGAAATVGVMLGDSTSYFIGYESNVIMPARLQRILQKIEQWGIKHPKLLPFFFFLYGAVAPFSNDFVGISMGIMRYPFWKVILPLGAGNLVFNTAIALFSSRFV